MSSQNPVSIYISLLDSTKIDDVRLAYRRNCKVPFVISSSFWNENSLIKVRDEEPAQIKIIMEEVKCNLRFNVIDLDEKDEDDRIPLREMISRTRVLNVGPLSNPTLISFADPRLKLRDEDLEDEEFHIPTLIQCKKLSKRKV